jgi:N-sulfoglucosamine sulfohydrolase
MNLTLPLTALLLASATALHSAEAPKQKPNIVWMISDDHGAADSGCYGNRDVRTPNLDRLAAEGMRFNLAFAASTLCSPSRAVIHTGLMPFRNGGHVFGGQVTKGTKTVSHYFQPLGYETALFGKTSLHPESAFPYDVKMPEWKPGTQESTSLPVMVDDFLTKRGKSKPLFLEVNTGNPHMPWMKNQGYDPAKLTLPGAYIDTPETRDALADYYTSITSLDATVEAVLNVLKKHGMDGNNTIFIYTSDHGSNFPLAKWCLYDAGIRVPLLVRWPGTVQPGLTTDAMVSLADLLPTMIDAAGGVVPDALDGRSFLKVLQGASSGHLESVFASHTGADSRYAAWKANWSPHRAIRTRTHKYILNLNPNDPFMTHLIGCDPDDPKKQPQATHPFWKSWERKAQTDERARRIVTRYTHRPVEELYDLRSDPNEEHNLASLPESAELLQALRKQLGEWRKAQNDQVPVHLTKPYIAPGRADPIPKADP